MRKLILAYTYACTPPIYMLKRQRAPQHVVPQQHNMAHA